MFGMKTWFERGCVALISVSAIGCGSSSEGTDTEGGASSGDSGTSTTQVSATTGSSSGVSESGTPTTGHESHSGSDTGETATTTATATDATTGELTATGTGSSTEPGTSTGGTEPGTSGDTTTTGDGTSTGDTGSSGDAESSTTEPGCIPAEEVCNDMDDDCDGKIDNVDVGGDGICDCLNIALLGNQGANPSAEFQDWLIAQGTKVDRIHVNPADVLDKLTITKYDIIILDYMVRSYTADEAATMKTWVETGGGLMAMTGFTNVQWNADRPNTLIKPMGLSYNTSKGWFSGPVTSFVPHPITMGLTSISFFGGLYIDTVEDGVGVNKTIMTLPQGPVGVVQDRVDGRLFIFGDEWIEFDSEWKNIPQIKQFWVQTLAWLGPKDSCVVPQ